MGRSDNNADSRYIQLRSDFTYDDDSRRSARSEGYNRTCKTIYNDGDADVIRLGGNGKTRSRSDLVAP